MGRAPDFQLDREPQKHLSLLPWELLTREHASQHFAFQAPPGPEAFTQGSTTMQIVHQRCAGLDVHQQMVVANARWFRGAAVHHDAATFETTTAGLMRMSDWLERHQVTHVAMEATGVYWRPVWHVLEGHFQLVLANAAHVRNVPGRKSDANDACWLADLLAHGLIHPSFVPPTPIQNLRDLTRTRKQLVREVAQHTLRVQKVLEDANIKITGVISDLMGVSGRSILNAIIGGENDPERLLACTTGRLTAPRSQLIESLRGLTTDHHRFLLGLHLRQIKHLEDSIAEVEQQIGRLIEPFRRCVELLRTMPGVSDTVAHMLVAEIGVDMSRFPSAGHLVAWAGLCPRLDESAGKRRHPHPPWGSLAQDHFGHCRLGCRRSPRHLSACPVLPAQEPPWSEEGDYCRRCLDADLRLPHAPQADPLPGLGRQFFPTGVINQRCCTV